MGASAAKRALICIGRGIGDIIQTTPLIQAVHCLGYEVDLWVVPDYPEAVRLLDGWSVVDRIITASREVHPSGYEEAIVTLLFPYAHYFYRRSVRVVRVNSKERRHRIECDMAHARALGYRGLTPSTYARTSSRRFDLPSGTIALHAGSSPLPWNRHKRWPYFPELARLLLGHGLGIVLVGMAHDGPPRHVWPHAVADFRGMLSLLDTGALLRQCDAVVSNDSGIAHYAGAVGVPTVVIFGPTSERLYAPPGLHVVSISADLDCRPCGNDLTCNDRKCLTELRAETVAHTLLRLLARRGQGAVATGSTEDVAELDKGPEESAPAGSSEAMKQQ